MKPHQNDDDMRIKTSADVLIGLQDRIAALECIADDLQALCDKQALMLGERDAQLEAVGAGGVGAMVPNEVESRELILQHAVMDSVQLMNGCVMTSATLQKAHELLRQALWDYSEAVSGTRKATDCTTLLVRALRSLEDTEKCHGSTTRRTVLMADIRSATIASAQPAPAVARPDGYCIPKSEQFTFSKSRPFSKAWQPFYLAAPPSHQIAEPASPWVSVAERLPPAHTDVMIYPRPTDYCCEAAVNTNGCWSYSEYESNWGQHRVPCRVTHWMPFPAAPTKEPS